MKTRSLCAHAATAARDGVEPQAGGAARAARPAQHGSRVADGSRHHRLGRRERPDLRGQRPHQGAALLRASPAFRPSPTTPASRSTRWAADPACAPDATRVPTPRTGTTTSKLLGELADFYGPDERTGRYQCVLVFVEDGEVVERSEGTFEGRVAFAPRGKGGFGYDPIFEPLTEEPGGRTVAQLTAEEKNRVSHRGLAAHAMRELLIARGY